MLLHTFCESTGTARQLACGGFYPGETLMPCPGFIHGEDNILRPSLITEHWRAVKTPSYQVRFKIGEGAQRGWKPLLSKANRTILPQGITVREMKSNVRIFMHFLVLMTLCIERLLICSTGPNIQLRQLDYTRMHTLMKYRIKESDASGKTGRSGRPWTAQSGPETISDLKGGDY